MSQATVSQSNSVTPLERQASTPAQAESDTQHTPRSVRSDRGSPGRGGRAVDGLQPFAENSALCVFILKPKANLKTDEPQDHVVFSFKKDMRAYVQAAALQAIWFCVRRPGAY